MKHIATVQLQEYYQHVLFDSVVSKRHWSRFESQLKHDLDDTLELLAKFNVTATFFTLGWIAERYPEIIQLVARAGHEISSAGFWGLDRAKVTQTEFRQDIHDGKIMLETVSGLEVIGSRIIRRSLAESELWILDLLAEEGFLYDSSLMPALFPIKAEVDTRKHFIYTTRRGDIHEFPHSTCRFAGFRIPIGGGNFLRQLPSGFTFNAFTKWKRKEDAPFILYFHPWELNKAIPEVSAFSTTTRIRQYRNLGKLRNLLPHYFETAEFVSIRGFLNVSQCRSETCSSLEAPAVSRTEKYSHEVQFHTPTEATVVIPCFNEESTIPFLRRAIDELLEASEHRYKFRFIFVDDKSTDNTLDLLQKKFSDSTIYTILPLTENQGVAGAIHAGIKSADTEIVCSLDADCSYDPVELTHMIELLDKDVALVTGSPYHAEGSVLGVPGWRLFLSRGLSKIYKRLLSHKLATYTSCFRVYRRSHVGKIDIEHGDFRGIVELLVKLDILGERIVEYPTTLQSRIFGYSKMNTIKTIKDHIRLLKRIPKYRKIMLAPSSIEERK